MNLVIFKVLQIFIISIFLAHADMINYTIYTGQFFNFSTPRIKYNKTMDWLQASNSFTYGFALPNMAGNKILLTGRCGTRYQLSVVSPKLSSYTLANKCNRLFESKIMAIIKVTKRNVSALSVIDRVGLLSVIARGARLPDLQLVMLTTAEGILPLKKLAFQQNLPRDSYFFVWAECSRLDDVDKIKRKLKTIVHDVKPLVGKSNWFLVTIANSKFSIMKRQRHKRFADSETFTNIHNKTLPVLKITDMQTMNFALPDTVFPLYSYPNGVEVYQIINGSKIVLRHNKSLWIRYTPSTRSIRFQPTLKNHGVHVLYICSNETSKNEICYILQINVAPLKPQVHQIHIRGEKNDYVINYTLPLVWFQAHKVTKDSQIQISSVKASIPVVWEKFNSLLFLNLSSVESTVLELMVDVTVNNQTSVQLELMLPLMSLAKTKLIIYHFRSSVKWQNFPFKIPKILLFEFRNLLEDMALRLNELLQTEMTLTKVSILPLQIYGEPFYSKFIEKDSLKFDWTFSLNSDLPSSCIIDSESILKSLSILPTKTYLFLNSSIIKSKSNLGCGVNINQKRTTLTSTTASSENMRLESTITPISPTDSQWKPVSIQNLRLSVECGKIFQYALPSAVSENQNLKISPVLFTGPKPDWITFSNNNKLMWGVIAKSRCPKKEFQFNITGTNIKTRTLIETTLTIDVISKSNQKEHKFQIDLVFINMVSFSISQLIDTLQRLTEYFKSTCQKDINCDFSITLLRSSVKHDSSVQLSLGYHENSTSCPQTLGIFLRNQIINKSSQKLNSPNPDLVQIFYLKGLGQLVQVNLLLNEVCQNKNIFPPDLGQKVVFNNIPSVVSLKPFADFYNHTVEFFIEDNSKNQLSQENYSQWMKMSNDSLTLYVLATTEHVRIQPYIVELSVLPNTKHKILLPKIAVEVRNLLHHPDFYPFIRELNHQIIVDVNTNMDLVDSYLSISLTWELCEVADRYLRSDCTDVSKNDCGTDILVFVDFMTKTQDGHKIKYKLSSLRILKDGGSSYQNDATSQKSKCPTKSLNQMEINLKNAFFDYQQSSNLNKSWTVESFKVIYLGPCSHTKTAFIKMNVIEEITTSSIKLWKENKVYFENTQQIFLMATVIPACSFIFITLLLGVATACLLNRRNRKKYSFNSATLKVQNYPPVIFQSDAEIYSPPSKPLILQNEKPPQPLPDDEEDGEALIPSIQPINFYRSAI